MSAMLIGEAPFINEQFIAKSVSPRQLDDLLAGGWRHFGDHFFRYSYGLYDLDVRLVMPLRIRLKNFAASKSQRRTLKKNRDASVVIRPISVDAEIENLFEVHKRRFKSGVPASIHDFLSRDPSVEPCEASELAIYLEHRLVAVSYFDVGANTVSGIYAMFDPEESNRRLGVFSMLKEIEFSIDQGKEFYYQGYAYSGTSFYDYKKNFRGTEWFDWAGRWQPLADIPEHDEAQ